MIAPGPLSCPVHSSNLHEYGICAEGHKTADSRLKPPVNTLHSCIAGLHSGT